MNEYEKQKTPSFTENPHDETILIDLSGTICYMSEGASKLFGYQEEKRSIKSYGSISRSEPRRVGRRDHHSEIWKMKKGKTISGFFPVQLVSF